VSIRAIRSPPDAETVQSSSRAPIDERPISVRLSLGHAELPRDLLVSRGAAEFRFQAADRALDVPRPRAHRTRHPIHRPQLVDDRALDSRNRVRLELDVPVRVVALDRADQPEQPVLDEVTFVDVARQAAADAPGDVLDERRIGENQALAQRLLAGPAVLLPERKGLIGLRLRGHGQRIRGREAISL
jgi:hypothetical protein